MSAPEQDDFINDPTLNWMMPIYGYRNRSSNDSVETAKTKDYARSAVRRAVRRGALLPPDAVPCRDCKHEGPARKHEYDHIAGYDRANRLNVEVVCTSCHRRRTRMRRRSSVVVAVR